VHKLQASPVLQEAMGSELMGLFCKHRVADVQIAKDLSDICREPENSECSSQYVHLLVKRY
jgi:hypothetical protein